MSTKVESHMMYKGQNPYVIYVINANVITFVVGSAGFEPATKRL